MDRVVKEWLEWLKEEKKSGRDLDCEKFKYWRTRCENCGLRFGEHSVGYQEEFKMDEFGDEITRERERVREECEETN